MRRRAAAAASSAARPTGRRRGCASSRAASPPATSPGRAPGAAAPSRRTATRSPPWLWGWSLPCFSPEAPMIVSPRPNSCRRPGRSRAGRRGRPRCAAARARGGRAADRGGDRAEVVRRRRRARRAARRPGCRRTAGRSACPCRSAAPWCRRPGPTGSAGMIATSACSVSFQPAKRSGRSARVGVDDLELPLRGRGRVGGVVVVSSSPHQVVGRPSSVPRRR